MPILNVLLSGTADEQKTQQVAHMLANCTSQILRKKPELTSIAIRYLEPAHWIALPMKSLSNTCCTT